MTDVRGPSRDVVELTFGTDEVRVIDLEPLLEGDVFEPLIRDYELFRQVEVDPEAGTTVWPNGASPRCIATVGTRCPRHLTAWFGSRTPTRSTPARNRSGCGRAAIGPERLHDVHDTGALAEGVGEFKVRGGWSGTLRSSAQDLSVQPFGLGGGVHAKLLAQEPAALLVGARGPGGVAGSPVCGDEGTMACLTERLECDELGRRRNRQAVVAAIPPHLREHGQRPDVHAPQAPLGLGDPWSVLPGQQGSPGDGRGHGGV